jgi:hypothetical protein
VRVALGATYARQQARDLEGSADFLTANLGVELARHVELGGGLALAPFASAAFRFTYGQARGAGATLETIAGDLWLQLGLGLSVPIGESAALVPFLAADRGLVQYVAVRTPGLPVASSTDAAGLPFGGSLGALFYWGRGEHKTGLAVSDDDLGGGASVRYLVSYAWSF